MENNQQDGINHYKQTETDDPKKEGVSWKLYPSIKDVRMTTKGIIDLYAEDYGYRKATNETQRPARK